MICYKCNKVTYYSLGWCSEECKESLSKRFQYNIENYYGKCCYPRKDVIPMECHTCKKICDAYGIKKSGNEVSDREAFRDFTIMCIDCIDKNKNENEKKEI